MRTITDPHDAFWFLIDHPKSLDTGPIDLRANNTPGFIKNLDMFYTKVNPATDSVSDNEALNTQTQVWLETGPDQWVSDSAYYLGGMFIPTHDPRLDVGGDTFDLALIALANKVMEVYGDYVKEGTDQP